MEDMGHGCRRTQASSRWRKGDGPRFCPSEWKVPRFQTRGNCKRTAETLCLQQFSCCLQLARLAVPSVLPAGTLKMHFWPEPLLASACQWLPVCEEELSVMVLHGQPILPLHPQPLVPPTQPCALSLTPAATPNPSPPPAQGTPSSAGHPPPTRVCTGGSLWRILLSGAVEGQA